MGVHTVFFQFPKSIFLKIDVDEQKEIAERYSIRAMPTFIAVKEKEQVGMIRHVLAQQAVFRVNII